MTYEPPKSFFESIECCDDYKELSSKSKALFIILSILLIGGGTIGCFVAAGAFSGIVVRDDATNASAEKQIELKGTYLLIWINKFTYMPI